MRNVLRWRRTCPICVFMRRSAFISTEARICSAQLHIRHKSKVYGEQLCASAQGLYWLLDRTDYSGEYAPTTSMHKTVARLCEARATAHTPTALHMDRVCVLRTTARGTSTGFGHALQIPQGGTCAAIELVTRAPKRYKHQRWHCTRSKGLRCA